MTAPKRKPKEVAKPAAKTGAERLAAFRARKATSDLAEVRNVYAHPEDHPEIKRVAMKVVRRRQRAERPEK